MTETITVTGNIATEPQQRPVGGGTFVTSFRIATTQRRLDRTTNAWVDAHTSFYTVSAFRSLGANAFAALHRGDRVIVTGRLRVKDWDNGTRQGTNAEIEADAIGHDLLWGVTRFERSGTPGAAQTASPEPAATPSPVVPDADAWSSPGADVPVAATTGADDAPF